MDRVVALGEGPVDVDELEADELETALLEAGEDPADEEALDAVGLDEDEGTFGHVQVPCSRGWTRNSTSATGRASGLGQPFRWYAGIPGGKS
jgi:hypothetical protein